MIDALRGDVEMKERDRFLCESATDSARALSAARETRPWAMTSSGAAGRTRLNLAGAGAGSPVGR